LEQVSISQRQKQEGKFAMMNRRSVLKAGVAATAITGFPAILRAAGSDAIRIGMPSIFSGRVAILGESSKAGANVVFDAVNAAGGIGGRPIELITRDSKGKPDEASRVVRDLVNNDGCDIILHAETSGSAFAIQEVIRDLGVLCIHGTPETSSLTADPSIRVETAFRSSRQGIHDAVGSGQYAARVAKEKGLHKWMSCSPDYAYGRSNTEEFFQYAKHFYDKIELVDSAWPKVFQPDYTEVVTKILNRQPQALYSALWGGDLVAFIDQAGLYGLVDNIETFAINLADYPVLKGIKHLPKGLHAGLRYNKTVPDTPENHAFYDAYVAKNNHEPTNWSWELGTGAQFIVDSLKATGGKTDGKMLAEALKGMTIKSPFGVDGTLTMRAEDHTLTGYTVGFCKAIDKDPYIADVQTADWQLIFELEKEWKKAKGYI